MRLGLLRVESYLRGAVYSSFFNIVGQGLGFVISVVFAYYFGTQAKTDVYYYCLSVLTLMGAFITNLDSSVIVPEAMRLAEQEGPDRARAFFNFFLYAFLAVGLAVTAAMWVRPVRFFLAMSRFDASVLSAHSSIVTWSVPLFVLMVVSQYLADVLASYKYFSLPMVLGVLNRLVVLACLVAFRRSLDILGIVAGVLLANLVQIAVSVLLMKSELGWRFSARGGRPAGPVFRNLLFAEAGNLATTLASYVPLFLLSSFSAGVLTALSYGQRLAAMPLMLITAQLSAVIGIKLNEMNARRDGSGMDEAFSRAGRALLFFLFPVSAFLFVYAREIVAVLYERGAFDAQAADSAAMFFRYFVLALPLLGVNTLVARLFMAAQKIREGFWYQVVMNVLLIGLAAAMLRGLGAIGYPLAQLAQGILNLVLLYALMRAIFPTVRYARLLVDFARIGAFNLVLAAVVAGVRGLTLPWGPVASLLAGGAVFGALFVAGNAMFPLDRSVNEMVGAYGRKWIRRAKRA
jgi:putative peptidoglycan lipid II flippase